jgi:O-antigen/teichoic acid export membrane protein
MLNNFSSIIGKGLTVNFIGSIGLMLFRFISISICTYLFGVDGYGEYIFAFAIISFFSLIIINGMDVSYIKFAHRPEANLLIFYCVKRLIIRLAAIIPVIILLGFVLQNVFEKGNILVSLLILIIAVGFDNISNMIVALNKFKLVMSEQYYYLFLKEICFIIMVFVTSVFLTEHGLFISTAIASLTGSIFLFLRSITRHREYFIVKWSFHPGNDFYITSKTLMYNSFVNRSVSSADILLLGLLLSPSLLGAYVILSKFAGASSLFQKSARTILYPVYCKLYELNDNNQIKKIFMISSLGIFFITSIIALIMLSASNKIYTYFNLPNDPSYQISFILLLSAKVIFSASGSSGSLLICFGHSKRFLFSDVVSTAVLITCLVVFVPHAQLVGAAVAVLISNLIVTLMRLYFVNLYIYKPIVYEK